MSWVWHVKNRHNINSKPPSGAEWLEVLTHCMKAYSPAVWSIPDLPFSDLKIKEAIERLNPDGTPGAGFTMYGSVNSEVITKLGVTKLVQLTKELIAKILEGAAPHPFVRVFIKQEATKKEKLSINRQRLIWSFPIVEQIVSILVFGPSADAEKRVFEYIPTKIGMSTKHGGWDSFIRSLKRKDEGAHNKWLEMDKSAWDWSVPGWLINLESEARWELCANPKTEFKQLYDKMYQRFALVSVVFSDGEAVTQTVPSIVKSGHLLTISANSRMQLIIKILGMNKGGVYNGEWLAAMGDDTLEQVSLNDEDTHEYVDALRAMGFHIKAEDINIGAKPEELDFCSQRTTVSEEGQFVPVSNNWAKTLFNMRHVDYTEAQFNQFLEQQCGEFAYDEDKVRLLLAELMTSQTGVLHWRSIKHFQRLLIAHDVITL